MSKDEKLKDDLENKSESHNPKLIDKDEQSNESYKNEEDIDNSIEPEDAVYEGFEVTEQELERLKGLSDDEAIIELDKITGENDELIDKDYLSALVNQQDRMVYYEIENLYQDTAKQRFKNRLKMRKDPPVLIVRDDFGNEVKFYLTENLTDELSKTLKQVKRAYLGFSGPSDEDAPKDFLGKVKHYVKKNPLKIIVTVFLILLIIILQF